MNQETGMELMKWLRTYPQTIQIEGLLSSYEDALVGVPDNAIRKTMGMYRTGCIERPNREFAPSSESFAAEARKVQAKMPVRTTALPAPGYRTEKGKSPYEIGITKMERDYEGYKLEAKNIALHVFNERALAGEYPPGTRWQAGRVYVPDNVRTQAKESA